MGPIALLGNKIQFGVVREDPQIEIDLITKYDLNSTVLIGSGGCTALALKTRFPTMKLTAIEPNLAQTQLIKQKINILNKHSLTKSRKLIGTSKVSPKIESGNFETLFKLLREFIFEFVLSEKDFRRKINTRSSWKQVFADPYWDTAFNLYFSDSLLISMFGPEAVQYAPKNSYPNYFKSLIEKGITRSDAKNNYFLHHIFFGHYFADNKSLPLYLQKKPTNLDMKFVHCMAHQFDNYEAFDLVSLSNILDWSHPNLIKKVGQLVTASLNKGSVLVYRQLNNGTDFKKHFRGFKWQPKLESKALSKDRSLFYSKICIGVKHD